MSPHLLMASVRPGDPFDPIPTWCCNQEATAEKQQEKRCEIKEYSSLGCASLVTVELPKLPLMLVSSLSFFSAHKGCPVTPPTSR